MPRLGVVLSLASAAVASAALLMTAALPHAAAPRFVETGPSILEEAFAKQKLPTTLDLVLPTDVAVEGPPQPVDGIYGPARAAAAPRSFPLRGPEPILIVASVSRAPAVVASQLELGERLIEPHPGEVAAVPLRLVRARPCERVRHRHLRERDSRSRLVVVDAHADVLVDLDLGRVAPHHPRTGGDTFAAPSHLFAAAPVERGSVVAPARETEHLRSERTEVDAQVRNANA